MEKAVMVEKVANVVWNHLECMEMLTNKASQDSALMKYFGMNDVMKALGIKADVDHIIARRQSAEAAKIEAEEKSKAEAERQAWEAKSLQEKLNHVNGVVAHRDSKRGLSASINTLCNELEQEAAKHPEIIEEINADRVEIYCPSEFYMPAWRIKE